MHILCKGRAKVQLGRNDGNPLYMFNAFGKIDGIESGHLIPSGDLSLFGQWDLHFEADWAEDALVHLLPYKCTPIPSPSAFWASDTHLGYEWRLNKCKSVDYPFVAQRKAVEDFRRDGVEAVWLPHAFEPEAYYPIPSIKKYDVCFIGHISSENRIEALDKLFNEFPNFWYGQRNFEEASELYCKSKIIFNVSVKDDLNMRVFETLGTQSFLLTNDIPAIHDLFEDGVHLVTYKDMDDCLEKAHYYLEHDEEREKIAEAGYKEVILKHTFQHRVMKILEVTGLLEKLKEPVLI